MGGINEDFVIANLICHAGGAGIRNRSSIVCDGFAGCFIGDTASIHHALHFRTVSNLGGYRFTGCIDKFICIIGDSAVLCGIGDIICILFDGGLIIPLFYTHQDFLEVLSDVGLIQDFAAVILKRNLGVCSIRSAVFHIGLISFYNRIGNFILVIRILGQYTECCIFRVAAFIGQGLADFICSHAALADRIIIFRPCIAAVFIEGRSTCLNFTRFLIHFQIHGLGLAAVDGGVVVFIQLAGESLGIEFAFYRKVTFHIQVAFHFCIAGNGQVAADFSFASGFQGTRFHCSCGLDGTCTHIQPGSGNLATDNRAGTHVQALTGNIAGYSQIATYGSIVIYSERIGSCIAGVGNAIGCQGSAYRGISSGRQGAEGTCGTVDVLASNGPGRRHVMSLHIAGGDDISRSINLVYPIQAAI